MTTYLPPTKRRPAVTRQAGLTLIELLVATAISMLIVLAAATALLISRQGFSNVDAASQLRDRARFAEDILQRLGVQAGHRDIQFVASNTPPSTSGLDAVEPNVFGFNNRARSNSHGWSEANTAARTTGSLGYGSDILVLRFQPTRYSTTETKTDQGMIDCSGVAPQTPTTDYAERYASVLHVAQSSDGEPALMCTRWATTAGGSADTQPLIHGVENFQVLYGVDGIGPSNSAIPAATSADSVPERYLRADQLTVSDAATTTANWQRVRSIRIGMVLRGPLGSAVDKTQQTYYPFGTAKASTTGAAGSMFASADDPGTVFQPTADGRLRQVVTFTIHLRNPQGDL
ncbi:MAG: PilW family protein [Acidovorax sp.]|uniref:PilW family protein n=1 Tax=Acidovorax sp. TaxID=1872122 RepID=UPI0039E6F760